MIKLKLFTAGWQLFSIKYPFIVCSMQMKELKIAQGLYKPCAIHGLLIYHTVYCNCLLKKIF